MIKLTLLSIICLFFSNAYSQDDILLFKKRNKTISIFKKESFIVFQKKNQQWLTGYITKVQNDSFYVRPQIIRFYGMGSDTTYYNVEGFAFSDVYAMPNTGIKIDYINGVQKINRSGGHVHWYWIKSGWIFRVGAGGYTGLNIGNSILKKNPPFAHNNLSNLGIAAIVYFFGQLLYFNYQPTLRIGRKFHFQSIKI